MIAVIFLIGLIGGGLMVALALALCKMSARCSPREQVIMDNEQVMEVSGKEKWAAKLAPTFNDGLGMMEDDES